MGGGGAMRTAGKVAGISVAGIRGALLAPPAEQSLRKASMPASAVVSSQAAKTSANEVAAPVYTAASWDMDDWEFPDESELFMQAGEPTPRVVFGAVPSFQEAKEATTELKEAIDQYINFFSITIHKNSMKKYIILSTLTVCDSKA